jgi:hypothetical protein
VNVYAATEGCYSDYHILAIFEDRVEAERYSQAHATGTYSDAAIEEMEYFPKGTGPHVTRYFVASACSAWGHDRVDVSLTAEDDPDGKLRRKLKRAVVKVTHHETYNGDPWVHVEARALDRVAAQKACADRWAQVRAELAGIA